MWGIESAPQILKQKATNVPKRNKQCNMILSIKYRQTKCLIILNIEYSQQEHKVA